MRTRLLTHIRRFLPRVASPLAFAVAAALIAAGVVLRLGLDSVGDRPLPPYITLYPAIVLSAFIGGIRVGLFAAAASAIAVWFLWMPPGSLQTSLPMQIITGLVYLLTGALTVVTSGLARLLLDDVIASEEDHARTARESVHRIKNLLAVVQSISRKVSQQATDVGLYRDTLEARLRSLATAQDILLRRDWGDVKLAELVQSTLGPFLPNPRLEVKADAPIIVPRQAVTQLSMALYELATNSLKYGALSNPNGFVRLEARRDQGRCFLEWREIGLTNVDAGNAPGLGATLIRSALSSIQDAWVRYDVTPQAISCVFDWPDHEAEAQH
jgi:two-component sensor histidine kinase